MDKRTPEKKERLLTALDKGIAMIHLDSRRPGVLVPAHLRNEPHLLLNLSYRFDPPDLAVGEWGVRSTLTFQGTRFTVAVPWSALYAISSHVTKEFWMYPDDMPRELIEQPHVSPSVTTGQGPIEASRGILREVASELDLTEEPPQDEPPKPAGRGHLRLVK
ncbi:MAG: ClpXP protease specificity-enhancing factor SspB [Myxococcaceae bacterium]